MMWLFHKSGIHEDVDDMCLIAWIHSHVRGAYCGLSSIDVHTQFAYRKLYPHCVSLVVEIDDYCQYVTHDFYELSAKGVENVEICGKTRNLSHIQHEDCSEEDFFHSILKNVQVTEEKNVQVFDFTKKSQEKNSLPYQNVQDTCKFCKKKFKSLIRHATQAKSCKEKFSVDDIEELKVQGKERIKEYKRMYNKINKDSIKRKQEEYNETNSEEIKKKQKIYNTKNASTINSKQKIYDANNSENINARQKKYDSNNVDRIRKRQREYNDQFKEEIKRKQAKYNFENKDAINTKEKKKVFERKLNTTMDDRILKFKKDTIDGPNFTCECCKRCLFIKSVKILKEVDIKRLVSKLNDNILEELLFLSFDVENSDMILCHNCLKLIGQNKIPSISESNGLQLDEVPIELSRLSELEQQLIARALIFMKIKKLPTSRMKAFVDRVISVPLENFDVEKTVTSLPRHPDDAKIIAVKLKRKLELKQAHLQEFISPMNVIEAVKALKTACNEFYKDVRVDEEFHLRSSESVTIDNEDDIEPNEENSDSEDESSTILDAVKQNQSRQNCKTCIMPMNLETEVFVNTEKHPVSRKVKGSENTLEIAPGEGKIPSNFLLQKFLDVMAFPKHHLTGRFGKDFPRKVKLSDQMFFNQRLLNIDERFSMDPFYLFMAVAFIERGQLERQINIAGLKGSSRINGNGECSVEIKDIYDVFKPIKGTPKYWQNARNELIAKVKQLGPFHIYFTFSCGEMRWIEVFISVLKRKGVKVDYPEDWDGSEDSVTIEGISIWSYILELSISKHELLKDYIFLITRIFDARVKSFIANILMGSGKDKIPISHYSYRVEFQARGMPHIHGVAWIQKQWLHDFGITNLLTDHPEKAVELADNIISCELPDSNRKVKDIVTQVQRHSHTKSCLKYNGTCRYGFPKLPSPITLVAKPLSSDVPFEERKEILKKAQEILTRARNVLESKDFNFEMSFQEFLDLMNVTEEEYMKSISISEKGMVLVMKRPLNSCFINNYNKEMILAWNANMDIQLAFDPYAVVTYIVSYVNKDESGTTKFLQEALAANAEKSVGEKLKALKTAYISCRQIGWSEAVYKAIPSMKLKDSNVACTFVPTGFPENRSTFYRKVKDQKDEELQESLDDESDFIKNNGENVNIEGRTGQYMASTSIHERYEKRPPLLEKMCLAQFAILYVHTTNISKKVQFDNQGCSLSASEQQIFDSTTCLPCHIFLFDKKLGYMRIRSFPAILRIHSKKKDNHEQLYSEMMLYCHWRNEVEDLKRWCPTECESQYRARQDEIQRNKALIYPGEATIALMEEENFDAKRPVHLFDLLNSQKEQENKDDHSVGSNDDPEYATFRVPDYLANDAEHEEFKYKKVAIPDEKDLQAITQRLVPEQMDVLRKVVNYCKDVVKSRGNLNHEAKPLKLIVHGGAGKIF